MPGHLLPGLALCAVIGVAACQLSAHLPVGAVVIALVLGLAIGNLVRPGRWFTPGIACAERTVLAWAIVLMGVDLDYAVLHRLGWPVLVLIPTAVALTILTALTVGRWLGLPRRLSLLLGIGNGICGSSAIAAAKEIVDADGDQVGLAVTTVNFLGVIGVALLPGLALLVPGLTGSDSGFLIGNTLQAVGQVVAAGFAVGEEAGQTATIVKMARILTLAPVLLVLVAGGMGRGRARLGGVVGVPWFVLGFILASLLPAMGLLSAEGQRIASTIGRYALVTAMAAIGLRVLFGRLVREGGAGLLCAALVFLVQIAFSFAAVLALFHGLRD